MGEHIVFTKEEIQGTIYNLEKGLEIANYVTIEFLKTKLKEAE